MKNIGCRCLASEYGKVIINKCIKRQISLSNIKLQQLLIITQGVMLASYHKPIFTEQVTGASYGLLLKEVNKDFFGIFEFNEEYFAYVVPLDIEIQVIDKVLNRYGQLDPFQLKELPEMKKLYKTLQHFNFDVSSNMENCIFESVFKNNIVVYEVNLEKDYNKLSM